MAAALMSAACWKVCGGSSAMSWTIAVMKGLSLMMRLVSNLPITRATTRMRLLQLKHVGFRNKQCNLLRLILCYSDGLMHSAEEE